MFTESAGGEPEILAPRNFVLIKRGKHAAAGTLGGIGWFTEPQTTKQTARMRGAHGGAHSQLYPPAN